MTKPAQEVQGEINKLLIDSKNSKIIPERSEKEEASTKKSKSNSKAS